MNVRECVWICPEYANGALACLSAQVPTPVMRMPAEKMAFCRAVAGHLDMAAADKSLQAQLSAAREEVTSLQQEVQELGLQQE